MSILEHHTGIILFFGNLGFPFHNKRLQEYQESNICSLARLLSFDLGFTWKWEHFDGGFTLELESTLIAVSSSRMFPSDDDRTSRILSSISCSCLEGGNMKVSNRRRRMVLVPSKQLFYVLLSVISNWRLISEFCDWINVVCVFAWVCVPEKKSNNANITSRRKVLFILNDKTTLFQPLKNGLNAALFWCCFHITLKRWKTSLTYGSFTLLATDSDTDSDSDSCPLQK